MSEQIKLGKLIEGSAARDAVHIAIAPVVAGELLNPGDHVGLEDGKAVKRMRPIGIVDPFIRVAVLAGERFFMLLYPQTVTGLRHEWNHPAFEVEATPAAAPSPSVSWLIDFAHSIGIDYDDLIEGAKIYLRSGHSIECPAMEWKETPPEFWGHYEKATGEKVDDRFGDNLFACCI